MLSRAVNVPRACFANRLSSSILSARATLSNRSLYSRGEWIQQRCYSSDPVIHSKEKIEALISGRISEREFKKSNKQTSKRSFKKSSSRKPWRRRKEEEIPDWGLAPLEIEASPAAQEAIERHLGEGFESELSEELREMLAEESLLKEEPVAEEPDADEWNQPEQSTSQEGAAITETDAAEPSQPRPRRGFKAKKDFHDELVQSRSVSVAALGEQIDAIMLKNPNEMKRPKRPVRRVQEDAAEATIELDTERDNMVDVKEESDEEAMRAAMKNIDDLRPVDKTILRMKDFDSLANTLLDGFTFNQLAKYFSQKRLVLLSKRDQGKQLRYPWIVKQEPWVAAKPDHWGPLRPKQRQVIMIMQIIWNLEVQEQVEGLGRTLVWLQPRIFELIASPNSAVLELLSRDFLYQSNKEKITTSFDDHRINIYARKSTIPAILSHLDETVRSIRSQKISSDIIQEHDLDEKLLRELERITKTHIAYDENNKELEISWLQKQHLASTGTESPADIALRLLLDPTAKDTQTSVHIITPSDISGIKDEAFVSHQRENRSMPWKDKLRQWSRFVTPVGQAAAPGDDASTQFPNVISDLRATKGTESVHQVTASFGHVLHGKHSQTVAAMTKHRRLLSPVLPHPASFTSIMEEDKLTTQRATIVLNFSPDPNHSFAKYDSAPPTIQLQLPVNPDSDLTGSCLPPGSALFGVAAQHINDVLLPSESLDVRMTQNHLLPLDASQEPVKEFLSQSEFNLPQGVLKTPSKAKFSIPKAWVTTAKTTRKPSKATINVPYIFMGLEIHQTVQLEFHGHTLCYNSIDAGRHGGHRQELSLQAGPPQGTDEPPFVLNEAEASHFLSLVEGVATGEYFSWHNGSQFMRETPDVGTLEDEITEDQLSSLEAEADDFEHVQSTESESLQNTEHEDGHPSTETAPEPSEDLQSPKPDAAEEPERK
ncbi:mitochondrial inner-membrane-bound regulator domain-containing protein [Trichoderma breve]|uniref:Mitochondrial inner-membrane-bound regulator domain-containing protein n=1 Tax=Trichoderma breve TaxID=2034170 RepID=A0A9W9EEP2_9HYPO|nr:mitochondrial inner-membrane-bound regulator domain-containing protein [Trichoderma breve]KAJ4865279.1 mitochondrial inner-membrane-bound regulator domain-containing protein [Trichoderma breve]